MLIWIRTHECKNIIQTHDSMEFAKLAILSIYYLLKKVANWLYLKTDLTEEGTFNWINVTCVKLYTIFHNYLVSKIWY